jgi:hypothetical protein
MGKGLHGTISLGKGQIARIRDSSRDASSLVKRIWACVRA